MMFIESSHAVLLSGVPGLEIIVAVPDAVHVKIH